MGWFGSLESPVSGQMVLRVEFAAQGTVKNTLDEGSSGRLWYMGATTLLTTTHDTLDEAMQSLTNAGIDVVRRTVPSLRFGGLQVQPDASGDTTELVVSGDVTYLRSEWDGYKQNVLEGGQTFRSAGLIQLAQRAIAAFRAPFSDADTVSRSSSNKSA